MVLLTPKKDVAKLICIDEWRAKKKADGNAQAVVHEQ